MKLKSRLTWTAAFEYPVIVSPNNRIARPVYLRLLPSENPSRGDPEILPLVIDEAAHNCNSTGNVIYATLALTAGCPADAALLSFIFASILAAIFRCFRAMSFFLKVMINRPSR